MDSDFSHPGKPAIKKTGHPGTKIPNEKEGWVITCRSVITRKGTHHEIANNTVCFDLHARARRGSAENML
jgi:hypothetical protein